jgi:cystathionine beta-lyase/cystathionine gamma-synthase
MDDLNRGLGTLCTHAGREHLRGLGVHVPPIDLSTTYPMLDPDATERAYDDLAAGAPGAEEGVYARMHNPTVASYEAAVARLEGADDAVAFSSGMAALTAVLLAVRQTHSHVVGIRPLYGGTDHVLSRGLLGLDVSWVGQSEVADAITPETGLVICETPQNPTLGQVDIAAVAAAARDVPVLVDNTLATPVLQQPLRHGAALVLHSATKALGGHGDVLAGIVAARTGMARRVRQVRVLTGGVLHPMAAYLLHRSLQTLELRVLKAQENARAIVSALLEDERIERVYYPGLGNDPRPELLGTQLAGAGALVSFAPVGGAAVARRLMQSLRVITPAVSLGGVDTLIQQPAALTHRYVDPIALEQHGVDASLLRLSVGVECPDDLIADLRGALDVSVEHAQLTAAGV